MAPRKHQSGQHSMLAKSVLTRNNFFASASSRVTPLKRPASSFSSPFSPSCPSPLSFQSQSADDSHASPPASSSPSSSSLSSSAAAQADPRSLSASGMMDVSHRSSAGSSSSPSPHSSHSHHHHHLNTPGCNKHRESGRKPSLSKTVVSRALGTDFPSDPQLNAQHQKQAHKRPSSSNPGDSSHSGTNPHPLGPSLTANGVGTAFADTPAPTAPPSPQM